MDNQLEFTAQAFSKMIMHTMKYSHSVCCGLLLSPKPSSDDGDKEDNHEAGDEDYRQGAPITKIIDVVPLLHTSHYLAPAMEVALNSVNAYAQEQELFISGYYQVERYDPTPHLDIFGQRVTEKIAESYQPAVMCLIGYEPSSNGRGVSEPRFVIDQHYLVDKQWRRKPSQSYKVENGVEVIKERIIFSKEKLYRQIVDFDDHFNNISLDWTNARITQRIDHLVANIC